MVELKIRLYKDSSGVLLGEFLGGLNGISQNNANVNEVLVIVDGFELAPGEVLRISYEAQNGAEHIDYTLMNDNGNGTYSAEIDYAVTNGVPNSTWNLGLQIASNWVETESYIGYIHKQNLANLLEFKVNNSVKDRNGNYPKLGDITTLYLAAQEKIESSDKNAEEIGNVKTQVAEIEENFGVLSEQVLKNTEKLNNIGNEEDKYIEKTEKGQPNGIATLDENGKVPKEQLPDNLGSGESGGGSFPDNFNPDEYVKKTDRDEFVKKGITEPTETWTDNDKANACATIGAIRTPTITAYGNYVIPYIVTENGKVGEIGEPIRYLLSAIQNTIPLRGVDGVLNVGTPTANEHATPKSYVNNLPDYLAPTITDEQKAKWRQMIGIDGAGGNGYTLTEADKAEIANLVLALLPSETWTFTLEDGTTATKKVVVISD